jgi:DNA modification methylase
VNIYKKSDIPEHLQKYFEPAEIGLEQTPEKYIAAMVEVFRCVRDVLADDGTLWLNLGSSYASGDKTPNQSPLRQRVPSCGTHGKAPQDSQVSDRACRGSCDELQGETRCRRENIAHICQCAEQDERQTLLTDQGNVHSGCVQSSRQTFQLSGHQSTTDAIFPNAQDALHPSSAASACQQETLTSLLDAQACAHKSACTCGTSRMLQPLAVHTKGKESFFSACRRSDCNGIGRCGYCFGSLTTASLNVKQKDELNIPHLVAMALQADGWVLRQTICWSKPNTMPESVRDRCTKAHEYLFLLSKSERYYFDSQAIKEPAAASSIARWNQNVDAQIGSDIVPGKANGNMKAVGGPRSSRDSFKRDNSKRAEAIPGQKVGTHRPDRAESEWDTATRNRRSVWTVPTVPYSGAHFAAFPPALIEPCIMAGSRTGDVVLDPFGGSGTTAQVSLLHGRSPVLCELNEDYAPLIRSRINDASRQERLFA